MLAQERRRICRAARGSASVNRLTWNSLQAAAATGKLIIMDHCCITDASWDTAAGQIRLQAAARPLESLICECSRNPEAGTPAKETAQATEPTDVESSEQAADGRQDLRVSAESTLCGPLNRQGACSPTVKDEGGQQGGRVRDVTSRGGGPGGSACADSCQNGGKAGAMGGPQSAACGSRPAGLWDHVWLATGRSLDVTTDPVLRALQVQL